MLVLAGREGGASLHVCTWRAKGLAHCNTCAKGFTLQDACQPIWHGCCSTEHLLMWVAVVVSRTTERMFERPENLYLERSTGED